MNIERATISLPGDLLQAAQGHCRDEHLKFSNYIEKLVRQDLVAVGKLPADRIGETLRKVHELIETRGVESVLVKLNELSAETIAAA